jgi:hypothetical protein
MTSPWSSRFNRAKGGRFGAENKLPETPKSLSHQDIIKERWGQLQGKLTLAFAGCAYLPRDPFCLGTKTYRGVVRRSIDRLPPGLRSDVETRSGVTFETWYEGKNEAVVIAVVPGRADRAFSYEKVGGTYRFISEKLVPCLEE